VDFDSTWLKIRKVWSLMLMGWVNPLVFATVVFKRDEMEGEEGRGSKETETFSSSS